MTTFQTSDPLGDQVKVKLPPRAQDLLQRLRVRMASERGAFVTLSDIVIEKRQKKRDSEAELHQLIYPSEHAVRDEETHPRVLRLREDIRAAEAQIAPAFDARDAAGQVATQTRRFMGSIESYLTELSPQATIVDLEVIPLAESIERGDKIEANLQRLDALVATCRTELASVLSAPITSQMAVAKALQQLDDLVARGSPDVLGLIEVGDPIAFATGPVNLILPGPQHVPVVIPDAIATLAWMFRGQFQAAIEAEIKRRADDKNALTDQQRTERSAALRARLLALQYQASALWWGEGFHLPPPVDIDPRAALLITGTAPREPR